MTLLIAEDIQSRKLVSGEDSKSFNSTSYDLTVGTILDHKGQVFSSENDKIFYLPPGGIAEVISHETVTLPKNITAFAHLKTRLVDEGKFSLNVGIVDPGWSGQISSTIINLSGRDPVSIQLGEKFLRLAFFEHEESERYKEIPENRDDYLEKKRQKIHHKFGEYFFGIDEVLERAKEDIGEIFGKKTRNGIAWIALVLAATPFLIWGYSEISTMARVDYLEQHMQEVEAAHETNLMLKQALKDLKRDNARELKNIRANSANIVKSLDDQITVLGEKLKKLNIQANSLKNP